MNLILLAVHKQYNPDERIVGFRLYDKDSKENMDASIESVYNKIASGNVTIDGICLSNDINIETGGLKGSNGSFERYTNIVNGQIFGNCPLVISKEYPDNIYEVINYLGDSAKMKEDYLIHYSESEGLANAKVVTKDNKKYISRISGEFEKDKAFNDLKAGETTKIKLNMLDIRTYRLDENNYAFCDAVESEQADKLKIGNGCLGIRENGFRKNKASVIVLPNTCKTLGSGCFSNMVNLKTIKLPEGIQQIPSRAFEGCLELEEIELPNSIRKIGAHAFRGCKKLKVIRTGPIKPSVELGAIPSGIKMIPRR